MEIYIESIICKTIAIIFGIQSETLEAGKK